MGVKMVIVILCFLPSPSLFKLINFKDIITVQRQPLLTLLVDFLVGCFLCILFVYVYVPIHMDTHTFTFCFFPRIIVPHYYKFFETHSTAIHHAIVCIWHTLPQWWVFSRLEGIFAFLRVISFHCKHPKKSPNKGAVRPHHFTLTNSK